MKQMSFGVTDILPQVVTLAYNQSALINKSGQGFQGSKVQDPCGYDRKHRSESRGTGNSSLQSHLHWQSAHNPSGCKLLGGQAILVSEHAQSHAEDPEVILHQHSAQLQFQPQCDDG